LSEIKKGSDRLEGSDFRRGGLHRGEKHLTAPRFKTREEKKKRYSHLSRNKNAEGKTN